MSDAICRACGAQFVPRNRQQKYCADCRETPLMARLAEEAFNTTPLRIQRLVVRLKRGDWWTPVQMYDRARDVLPDVTIPELYAALRRLPNRPFEVAGITTSISTPT
jgi:hypothetical protein